MSQGPAQQLKPLRKQRWMQHLRPWSSYPVALGPKIPSPPQVGQGRALPERRVAQGGGWCRREEPLPRFPLPRCWPPFASSPSTSTSLSSCCPSPFPPRDDCVSLRHVDRDWDVLLRRHADADRRWAKEQCRRGGACLVYGRRAQSTMDLERERGSGSPTGADSDERGHAIPSCCGGPRACAAASETERPDRHDGDDGGRVRPSTVPVGRQRHVACRRIGEADHPGPPEVYTHARRVPAPDASGAIKYPKPGGGCLGDAIAPGHRPRQREEEDVLRLTLETVNTTGWSALKKRMEETEAHCILAQETWIDQAAVAGAAAWARRHGWRSIWAPALTTTRGGTAAGVAILVRDCFGLHLPNDGTHILSTARAVTGIMEVPGGRPIRLISCYLRHGNASADLNAEVLGAVGAALEQCSDDEVHVVGGDFNADPAEIVDAEFDRRVGATVFCADTDRGTYRTAKACSTIDYFMVADRLAAAVECVRTVEASSVRGHVPVQLAFKPRLAAIRALHVRQPPRLATERVYGPLPPPGDWTHRAAVAEAALAAARAGSPAAERIIEMAYAQWADGAEEELEAFTGVPLAKRGERGKRPRLVWRNVLPERRFVPRYPSLAAAVWLKGVSAELQRIVATAARAGGAQRADGDLAHGPHALDDPDDDGDYVPADTDEPRETDTDLVGEQLEADSASRARRERRGRRPPTSWRHCCGVLEEISHSLEHDAPQGEEPGEIRELRTRLITIADDIRHVAEAQPGPGSHRPTGLAWSERQAHWTEEWPTAVAAAVAVKEEETTAVRITADAIVEQLTRADKADNARSWREWVREGIDAGAGRAHAATRLPQEVVPTVVETKGGTMSAAPEELLDAQRRKLAQLWKPADCAYRYQWRDKQELPAMGASRLRAAALTFRWRTTQTFDGFHPRQLGDLPDDALEVLSVILQAVEVSGVWPPQIAMVITALLPKPKGGLRPIGILPGVYRLWAKARREEADAWEAAHLRPYFSSAKGNGPLDTLWRMTARHEAGVAEDQQAGIVADDLAAFFETVSRETLMREAQALGYPAPVLRAALAAYAAPRMLTLQGRVARELYPTVGVVAGCSLAMSLVKLFYLRAFDGLASRAPPAVTIDVHVDDVTIAAVGNPRQVIADLAAARADLIDTMRHLGCTIAEDKTAVTATTRRLAADLANRLGLPGGVVGTPCLLGVDSTAGGKRARLGRTSKKAARLRAALARRGRIQRLRRDVGHRAIRVFRSGVLPAAAYDSPIWGLSDAECLRLRRLAAAAMSPRAKGRSLTRLHLWHGLPTADTENAPIIQYGKMVWRAITRREDAMARGASLADLRRMWEAASTSFAPLAQRMLEARGTDGAAPRRVARRIWAEVRGPLAAAAVSLARCGCKFQTPFTFVDALGVEHCLTTMSPRLLRDTMREMTRIAMERKVGSALAAGNAEFEGRRACLDLAISASKPSKRLTPHQAAAFRAVACGAVWTATKARDRGYVTDGLCPLCKAAPDTVDHRTYGCSRTEEAVRSAVPTWFWEESQRANARSPFWTTAILPHPTDLAPPPREDFLCEVEHHTVEGREAATDDNRMEMKGALYVDGSCFPSPIRGLARASMAIRMVGPAGEPVKTMQLAVPRHLPQTAQVAEHMVTAVAYQHIRGPAQVMGDCLNVVKAFAGPIARALKPTNKYAGIVMSAYNDIARWKATGIRWVKAHRKATGEEGAQEAIDIAANAAVDLAAKEAAALHPPLGIDVTTAVDYHVKRAPHVVAAVTAAMKLFPPAPTDMPRVPKPATHEEALRVRRHHWQFAAGAWRCTACGDYVTCRSVPAYRRHQTCTGKNMADSAPDFSTAGHTLIRVEAALPFVMCTNCGSWGNRRTRGLGHTCVAPTSAGKQAINRVREGWHPLLQRDRAGNQLPRQRVRAIAAYDPTAQAWRAIAADHQPAEAAHPQGDAAEEERVNGQAPWRNSDLVMDVDTGGGAAWEMERPPSEADDAPASEPDVFGHGGDLDDCFPAATRPRLPPSPAAAAAAPTTEDNSRRPTASRRRQRSRDGVPWVDHALEAVKRLGATLSRKDTDPRGRMERLRTRVAQRTASGATCPSPADQGQGCRPHHDADRSEAMVITPEADEGDDGRRRCNGSAEEPGGCGTASCPPPNYAPADDGEPRAKRRCVHGVGADAEDNDHGEPAHSSGADPRGQQTEEAEDVSILRAQGCSARRGQKRGAAEAGLAHAPREEPSLRPRDARLGHPRGCGERGGRVRAASDPTPEQQARGGHPLPQCGEPTRGPAHPRPPSPFCFLNDDQSRDGSSASHPRDGSWGIGGAHAPACRANAIVAGGGNATGAAAADMDGSYVIDVGAALQPRTRAELIATLRSQADGQALTDGGSATVAAADHGARDRGRAASGGHARRGTELAQRRGAASRAEPLHAARGEGEPAASRSAALPRADTAGGGAAEEPVNKPNADAHATGGSHGAAAAAGGSSRASEGTAPGASKPRAVPSSVTAARGSSRSVDVRLASGAVPARRRIRGKQPPVGVDGYLDEGDNGASHSARTNSGRGLASHGPLGRPPECAA